MARETKQPEQEQEQGAPEWMVTFSDCMTLLLTFFVLLLTFSSFDNKVFSKLKVIYSDAFTTIIPSIRNDTDSLIYTTPIENLAELDKGSEKPTLDEGTDDGLIDEMEPVNFNEGIVFILASNNVFWGKGTTITTKGRELFDDMALLLNELPHRIVISENGKTNTQDDINLGLQRAWSIMEYFTTTKSLDRERFSISAVSTLAQENKNGISNNGSESNIEIVLLTRSSYN
ncbi:flagellar motor protein MotB [Planctomycetota bacterium]